MPQRAFAVLGYIPIFCFNSGNLAHCIPIYDIAILKPLLIPDWLIALIEPEIMETKGPTLQICFSYSLQYATCQCNKPLKDENKI